VGPACAFESLQKKRFEERIERLVPQPLMADQTITFHVGCACAWKMRGAVALELSELMLAHV
jgi:hypothetical protein